ncbi:carbohydrate kinase family protein [Angelakisella massiliensis]|uniref:carbohydrate kinase family protein n=1 Tax=Angelakisella massiliensis TaxID=1871018 RepID=UPI0008F9664E|nr:carbohydrate kinase [Angelakisella massiliensis]
MMDVTAIGELLVDLTARTTGTDGYPVLEAHPGGAPCNFLAALSRFGARTALIAKVGDDTFGHLLEQTAAGCGIDTRNVLIDPDVFTTLAFVTLDSTGDRKFAFARKPGADTCLRWEEIDQQLLGESRFVHFGSLSLTNEPARDATRRAIAYSKEHGALITFDPNLRPPLWADLEEAKEQMLYGLAQADIVKISEEEVRFLFDLDEVAGARHILEQFGVSLVFVTLGADGCYYANAQAQGKVPGFVMNTVDTTGAGDIFGGSALSQVLRLGKHPKDLTGEELEQVVRFACASAALSTTVFGGIPSVPSPEAVAELLATR